MNFEKIVCFKSSKMPLSEFYRSINGKNESSQQKSNEISYIPNDEFVELIWEKGQIMMHGQSSKAKKTPVSNNFQFQTPKVHEKDGILDVPMHEIGLNQDDDILPWLNYPIDDYCSDLLPEISGVTVNEPNNMHKQNLSMRDGIGFDQSNISKGPRNSHLFSWSLDQVHNSDPTVRSGVTDIGSSNYRSKIQGTTQNLEKKVQKQDSLLNFSHFSRPAAIAKTHLQQKIGLVGQSGLDSVKVGSNPFASKPVDEPQCVEKSTPGQEKSTNVVIDGKVGPETVKSNEPVGASSSACSGNSAERASNDLTKSCKRKSRDTEDFECQSQDVEEESLGTKNASGSRSGSGSKRSRAAEVHNLSERRRRDRINEKMRALQELIPNCNKVDKASMLDEAIEYLKTLQLQVQIMSMASGLCMPQMMLPNGMQHMHPHFSPMGMGMNGMFSYSTRPMYGNHTQGMPMLFPQQGIPSVRQIGPQPQVSDVGPSSKDPNGVTQLSNQPLVANKSINQSNSIDKKNQGLVRRNHEIA